MCQTNPGAGFQIPSKSPLASLHSSIHEIQSRASASILLLFPAEWKVRQAQGISPGIDFFFFFLMPVRCQMCRRICRAFRNDVQQGNRDKSHGSFSCQRVKCVSFSCSLQGHRSRELPSAELAVFIIFPNNRESLFGLF